MPISNKMLAVVTINILFITCIHSMDLKSSIKTVSLEFLSKQQVKLFIAQSNTCFKDQIEISGKGGDLLTDKEMTIKEVTRRWKKIEKIHREKDLSEKEKAILIINIANDALFPSPFIDPSFEFNVAEVAPYLNTAQDHSISKHRFFKPDHILIINRLLTESKKHLSLNDLRRLTKFSTMFKKLKKKAEKIESVSSTSIGISDDMPSDITREEDTSF